MRPHPRIRKSVKWGGAVVCAALVALWLVSGWCIVRMVAWGRCSVDVFAGRLEIRSYSDRNLPPEGLLINRIVSFDGEPVTFPGRPVTFHPIAWRFASFSNGQRLALGNLYQEWYIPLWAPFVIVAAAMCVAWHLDTLARRRAKLGFCPKCSYSRAGLAPSAVCPECGSPAPVPVDTEQGRGDLDLDLE